MRSISYLLRACYSKKISQYHLVWQGLNGRQQNGKALQWGEKKELFKYVLITGYWHGYPGGGLTRNPASYEMGLGSVYGFLW